MTKRFMFLGTMVMIGILSAPAARADIVKWTVRGTVSLFTGSTPAIPFAIAAGEQYVLTIRLDDSMPTTGGTDVSTFYQGGFLEATLTFVNGAIPMSFTAASGSPLLSVTNDAYSLRPTGIVVTDSIDFSGRASPVNQRNDVLSFNGSISQTTPPSALTSRAFPDASEVSAFFDVASSTAFRFTSDIAGRYYAEIRGNVESVEVSAVPLPATAWLMLSSLGMLLRRRR
jgi:hypothetical protein